MAIHITSEPELRERFALDLRTLRSRGARVLQALGHSKSELSLALVAHIRSDNGPEFIRLRRMRGWLGRVGAKTLYIEPGSPWENGYIESFNGKLRDELLDREVFYTLEEVQVLTERWRQEYNRVRPHSALGYRSPVPETILVYQPILELVTLT